MFGRVIATGLMCCALVPNEATAGPSANGKSACASWQGNYSGNLSEGQSFFRTPEKVAVTVEGEAITVQIWQEDRGVGGFLASGLVHCTKRNLQGTLDTGADGAGKISVSMRQSKAVHLRLWNYQEGIGPNKAGYLPPESLEIRLRRLPTFED